MKSTIRRLAVLATALACVAVTVPPGYAQRLTVPDARGDMAKIEEGATVTVPAPGATNGDIVRTRFGHTDHRVRVNVRFAELAPTGRRLRLWVDVRDGRGRTSTLGVLASRRDRDGHTLLMTARGRDVPCRIWHRIDYRENSVRVGLPRRCLGSPTVVQFSVLSEHVRRDWAYAWLDNGLGREINDVTWTRRLRRG
jgi:hypothetical protein